MFSTGYQNQTKEVYETFGGFPVKVLLSYCKCVGFETKNGYLFEDYTYSNTTARHIAEFCGMNKRERQRAGCSSKNFARELMKYILENAAPEDCSFADIAADEKNNLYRDICKFFYGNNVNRDDIKEMADELLREISRERIAEATQQTTNATKQAKRI